MFQAMATSGRPQQLRQHLAATVTKMQWSYAIFWSNLTRQQGVLAWSDGYYNGEIKTRNTSQPMEFQDDPTGLQRSEQLRELYASLSAGDNVQQATRPSASLAPEDLTDTEWYYLVCMSFAFTPGQCLPGRSLMNNQHIWLTDAQFADAKLFTRSLLAKSASIQTVVCFPFMDGIVELGTTELVLEDPAIVQQIETSLLEAPVSARCEQCLLSSSPGDRDEDLLCPNLRRDIVESVALSNLDAAATSQAPMENVHLSCFPLTLSSLVLNGQSNGVQVHDMNRSMRKEVNAVSSYSSHECCAGDKKDDSFLIEETNDMSQVQMRDDGSSSSNDFMSVSLVNPQRAMQHSSLKTRGLKEITIIDNLRGGDHVPALDPEDYDSHYTKTIATVLRHTQQPTVVPCFCKVARKSSFTVWKRDPRFAKPLTYTPQKLLKNILAYAAQMCASQKMNISNENGQQMKVWTSEGDGAGMNHVISERKRREKLNEKFLVLRTIVPLIGKTDNPSVLGDTIEYLKELKEGVEELESCRDLMIMEVEIRGRRKHLITTAARISGM